MSDGRKRLSGAAYRKAAQEKLEKMRQFQRKFQKYQLFFEKQKLWK